MTLVTIISPSDAGERAGRHTDLVARPAPPPSHLSAADLALVEAWTDLVRQGRVAVVGPVRQEVLSGISSDRAYHNLRDHLRAFDDSPLATDDYEQAARFASRCRSRGIAGTPVDYLICAAAVRRDWSIFTTDDDFGRYAKYLPVQLYVA